MGPIKAIKLALTFGRMEQLFKQLSDEVHMKFSWNMVFQVVATVGQVLNVTTPFLPQKWQTLLAALLGSIQGAVAGFANFSNPDGTKAGTAYIPTVTATPVVEKK
jgi:hypothetical protein